MALEKKEQKEEIAIKKNSNGKVTSGKPAKSSTENVDFLQVLEGAALPVVMTNTKDEIIYFNESAEELFGYEREEVIGNPTSMLVPPQEEEIEAPELENGVSMESKVLTKEGKILDVWFTRSESINNNEKIFTAFIQDISKRKELEEQFQDQLEESKAQEEEMRQNMEELAATQEEMQRRQLEMEHLKSSVDAGWASIEFEPDGTIITANQNFLDVLGYSTPEEIAGKHHRIFCEKEYAESYEYKQLWNQLAAGKIQSGEFKRITSMGNPVWINASYTPVRDVEGRVVKVIKIASDITDMVEARTQGENIKKAVDAGWAYIEFEPAGTVVGCNQNFLKTFGYKDQSEIEGEHHRIFCDSKYTASHEYTQFWKDLANGINKNGEYARIRKDGKLIWLQAAYTPVRNAKGEIEKVIKIAADISEVKLPVLEVSKIIGEMAQGDLTKKFDFDSDGYVKEMGDALNVAIENLNALLGTIDESARQVASAADNMKGRTDGMKNNTAEMASAISQMAKGAQDQAQRTDESSKLAEQVLESAMSMETKSEIINKAAEKGVSSCEEGLKMIKNLVNNMSGINDSASLTSQSIQILTGRAEEIGRTLNVITDIAAQTNLLALNAAIEAARAGDAGRGFAVVAEEIRKLAEDSRKSAVDIEKIIGDVQKDTQSASKAIDIMTSSVKDGTGATKEAEKIFEEISTSSAETLELSKFIKEASSSQKSSVDIVAKNIEQIVVVAEETAAGTEEIATSSASLNGAMEDVSASSSQLTQISLELKQRVNKFKLKNHAEFTRR
ncbi:methyl-accepting chemotaxis protein [Fulvivirga sediminis]|uniref:PAS domain S-box protein n=1 Tax=Fulvivirga sediminis TaxID=2803949 RepID=A0A937F684_9BACT|nr:PAS domain S-box protein [Fulvivirga sediminis]MBL3655747.1 PAS domain S-box protein [Fulvivirga sediminis]